MKTFSLLVVSLFIATLSFAQKEKAFTTPDMVWFGLDYSHVRCIGSEGFNDPDAIVNQFFDAWNNLMLSEESKYDFMDAYGKESRVNSLETAEERNDMPDPDEIVINESYVFEPGTLEEIVKAYQTDEYPDKVGLLYVVESLNKNEAHAAIHIVFFDPPTGEILFTQQHFAKAGGFGFRNYWARPIYDAMEDSGKQFTKAARQYR